MKPILIGCEESQVICSTFRKKGFECYSCDILPTRGNPEWHIQADIKKTIKTRKWSLVILHPDCTALSLSGNRWYGMGMPYHEKRLEAIEWTLDLWKLALKYGERVALENPTSVIFKYLKNVQYIQPYDFGHGEQKKTGFALYNLPRLMPTKRVSGREQRIWKMGPSPTRKRDRAVTYQGIADAIVNQWGEYPIDYYV